VQLFNAITQAQKAKGQAEAAGEKGATTIKETKAALLNALQPAQQSAGEQPILYHANHLVAHVAHVADAVASPVCSARDRLILRLFS
jgi:hypothetical protein